MNSRLEAEFVFGPMDGAVAPMDEIHEFLGFAAGEAVAVHARKDGFFIGTAPLQDEIYRIRKVENLPKKEGRYQYVWLP